MHGAEVCLATPTTTRRRVSLQKFQKNSLNAKVIPTLVPIRSVIAIVRKLTVAMRQLRGYRELAQVLLLHQVRICKPKIMGCVSVMKLFTQHLAKESLSTFAVKAKKQKQQFASA